MTFLIEELCESLRNSLWTQVILVEKDKFLPETKTSGNDGQLISIVWF